MVMQKMLCDYLRQIVSKDCKQLPSSVKDGDTKLIDPQDIVNNFNDFFTMIVDKYVFLTMIPPSPDYSHLKNFIQSKINRNEKFSIPLITEDKVTKLLANREENKATGLDGVSAKLL